MAKVTSKYQVSIPKSLAEQLRIRPGDDIEWTLQGEELRIAAARRKKTLSVEDRLEMFDAATRRQAARDKGRRVTGRVGGRGWKREDLHERGRTR